MNAIAVGKSPRYMTPKEADAGAVDRSYISVLVQGDRPIVPAAAPVMLVLSVSCRRRFVRLLLRCRGRLDFLTCGERGARFLP